MQCMGRSCCGLSAILLAFLQLEMHIGAQSNPVQLVCPNMSALTLQFDTTNGSRAATCVRECNFETGRNEYESNQYEQSETMLRVDDHRLHHHPTSTHPSHLIPHDPISFGIATDTKSDTVPTLEESRNRIAGTIDPRASSRSTVEADQQHLEPSLARTKHKATTSVDELSYPWDDSEAIQGFIDALEPDEQRWAYKTLCTQRHAASIFSFLGDYTS